MAGLNIMSLYTDAYLADTTHLSTEQHGAYLLILVAMWRAGGELPDDPAFLQRVTKVSSRRWPRMWKEICHFFDTTSRKGSISQKRLRSEYVKALHKKEVYSLNGKRGGRPSGQSNPLELHGVDKATGSDPVKRNESETKANSKLNESHHDNISFDLAEPPENHSLLLTPNSLDSAANSESENATPKTAARLVLDQLEAKCREAAGLVNDPWPTLMIMQPITALLDAGYDLDTDILPILRKFAKAGRKAKSWAYYVEAIKESRYKARAAANGSGEHRTESTPAVPDEVKWRRMFDWWKKTGDWPIVWGPGPDIYGCEIPKHLIERWSAET